MQGQQKFLIGLLGLSLLGMLSNEAVAIRGTKVGMVNPASLNCLKQGGRLLTINTPYGEAGYCLLPTKQVCEEWAFLNHKCPKASMKQPRSASVNARVAASPPRSLNRKPPVKPIKPSRFKSITLADGYRTLAVTDVNVIRMAKLAAQQLSHNKATVNTIVWAQRKKGSGQNYRMLITLSDGKRYSALVYQAPGNHPPLLREANLIK